MMISSGKYLLKIVLSCKCFFQALCEPHHKHFLRKIGRTEGYSLYYLPKKITHRLFFPGLTKLTFLLIWAFLGTSGGKIRSITSLISVWVISLIKTQCVTRTVHSSDRTVHLHFPEFGWSVLRATSILKKSRAAVQCMFSLLGIQSRCFATFQHLSWRTGRRRVEEEKT